MAHGDKNGAPAPANPPLCRTAEDDLTDRQLLELFAGWQDSAAFAALIRRHGPMVLGVCRRILNHEQETEDAFQATFMVLVRKAGAIERPELLGNWLYGVASRTAQKARARLARRRHHERQVDPMSYTDAPPDSYGQELRTLLDSELGQLPTKYRAPLVLCYLEGMTNEEAARRLGWPTGSISYRLARGRHLLRERLRQRRSVLSSMALGALIARHAGPEDVPPYLADATLRAALGASDRRVPVLPLLLAVTNQSVTVSGAHAQQPTAKTATEKPARPTRRRLVVLLIVVTVGISALVAGVATGAFRGYLPTDTRPANETNPATSAPGDMPASCH